MIPGNARPNEPTLADRGEIPTQADRGEILVSQRTEPGRKVTYRVIAAPAEPAPAFLSCSGDQPRAAVRYAAISLSRATWYRT